MVERHTLQDRVHPVYRGTRRPVPEKFRPEPDAAYAYRPDHDYTYGLSKASLRPVVLDEDYPLLPKPRRPRTVRDPEIQETLRRIQPILYDNTPIKVDMPPDDEPDLSAPWWLDEDILVSRNEDMLSDLLAESQ